MSQQRADEKRADEKRAGGNGNVVCQSSESSPGSFHLIPRGIQIPKGNGGGEVAQLGLDSKKSPVALCVPH